MSNNLTADWLLEEMDRIPVDYAMIFDHGRPGTTADLLSESQAASLRAKMAERYSGHTGRDLASDLAAPIIAEQQQAAGENDRLRAALANGGGPCAYCSLSRDDWSKCQSGFPGCGRADDAMLCPHFGAEMAAIDRAEAAEAALAQVTAERDEADRRAGAAERKAEHDREANWKRNSWLSRAKEQAGYHDNVSFDRVWAETLAKAERATSLDQEIARLRCGGTADEWSPIATAPSKGVLVGRPGSQSVRAFLERGKWWLHGCGPNSRHPVALEGEHAPTHWQHLPQVPAEAVANSTDSAEPPQAA